MAQKAFLPLLLLFLGFSIVLSTADAGPTSRSLNSFEDEPSVQNLLPQGEMGMRSGENLSDVEEFIMERRMDIESNDYPGTGANNHHDPRSPGLA